MAEAVGRAGRRAGFAALLGLALLAMPSGALAGTETVAPADTELPACGETTVGVMAENGPLSFSVEIAATPSEQSRGLMFRPSLPADAGMLFVYDEPRLATFWMKNTMITLDIIFAGDDGRVLNVAERTTPYSLRRIPSKGPVRAVLEVNGGLSERHGIRAGTQLVHPVFEQAEPPFRCPSAD